MDITSSPLDWFSGLLRQRDSVQRHPTIDRRDPSASHCPKNRRKRGLALTRVRNHLRFTVRMRRGFEHRHQLSRSGSERAAPFRLRLASFASLAKRHHLGSSSMSASADVLPRASAGQLSISSDSSSAGVNQRTSIIGEVWNHTRPRCCPRVPVENFASSHIASEG